MRSFVLLFSGCVLVTLTMGGCKPPGKPDEAEKWLPPSDITSFDELYNINCAACHSITDAPAAAIAMKNPLYIEFAGEEAIRTAIRNGVPGTAMPGFSAPVGGGLTDQQIEILVDGIMKFGSASGEQPPADLPPYAYTPGDLAQGGAAFATYCASCHGADGAGGEKAASVVDPYFLDLVTGQGLKTSIVVGRAEFGMPDYRKAVPGRIMSNEEINSVVTWLLSQRHPELTKRPVQPGASSN